MAGDDTSARHGTRSRYNLGCRCPDCTTANKLRMRDLRAKRRGLPVPQRSGEPVVAWRPPAEPGPAEQAVTEEVAALSAAETRLGAVQAALAMARILDSPDQIPTHVRAASTLDSVMTLLRKVSGLGARGHGRLASVQPMRKKKRTT
jgi:hypothetical protein